MAGDVDAIRRLEHRLALTRRHRDRLTRRMRALRDEIEAARALVVVRQLDDLTRIEDAQREADAFAAWVMSDQPPTF